MFVTDRGIAYFTYQSKPLPIFPDVNHLKCKNNLALEERKKTFKQVRYIATEAITQDWTWEEKKIPAGKEIHQKLAVYLHNYRNRLWKNLSQNFYKTLGMKKGNSSVRTTSIIISIISVISFPLTSDSLTRNAPFYLWHWIYCKPLFYRTVFIETKISSDAPKNVKYLYKTFEKIIVDLNFYTRGVFLR